MNSILCRSISNFSKTFFSKISKLKKSTIAITSTNSCVRTLSSTIPLSVQDDPSLWVKSVLPDVGILKGVTMQDYAFEHVSKWENATAFECGLSGRKYTFGQIYQLSRNFGAALQKSGLKRGDVLAIILPNMPEFSITLFGTWFAGLIPTTVNPTYTAGEIAKQLTDCETKCIVTIPLFVPVVKQVLQNSPTLSSTKVVVIGEVPEGCHSFMDMVMTDSSGANLVTSSDSSINTETDTAALMYSSGTTGVPKGCMLTHSNLVNNCHQFIPVAPIQPFTGGNPQVKALGLLPFFHIMGFQAFNFITLRLGGHVVCMPKFEPDLFVKALKEHQFSCIHLITPLIAFVIAHPALSSKDFEKIENIFSGACPSGEAMIQRLLAKIGHNVNFMEGYGMTELSPVSHSVLVDAKNTKVGSIGPPIPGTVSKVIDIETGKTLGPNEKGEICVKGIQVMKGYHKNEEATNSTIDSDGWLHTGDIGYYKEDKYFYVVDRLKELIKVKGLQVAPSELEATLREHPKIADAAVIGIPHPEWGEQPRAYVVKSDDTLSESEVTGFIKDKLSRHKHLAGGVEFIMAVPKAPSGKILRRPLKEGYLNSIKS